MNVFHCVCQESYLRSFCILVQLKEAFNQYSNDNKSLFTHLWYLYKIVNGLKLQNHISNIVLIIVIVVVLKLNAY